MSVAEQGVDAQRRSVFIADDDDVARTILQAMLTAAGLDVVGEAADGRQAWVEIKQLAQTVAPDVVCLDIDMPSMSGLDVLARLRGSAAHDTSAYKQMIVLLITAAPTAQNVRQAIRAGADGLIAKPFNQEKIANEIARIAARKTRQH